jgi:biotin carboxylase
MAASHPESLLTLDFRNIGASVTAVRAFARERPIDAVIPVDDDTAVVAAALAEALGLRHNSVASAEAARDKSVQAALLARAGVRAPSARVYETASDPERAAREAAYPCVLKPLFLSASRGVIRADMPEEFAAAWRTIRSIVEEPEVAARGGEAARRILVEEFVPGTELALEGLLAAGTLRVLALFDKPDPLDGPYFEETIYVTPSRHPDTVQRAVVDEVCKAARALGLSEGPVHAEVRCNADGPWVIEVAARSIGGLCARALRFGTGLSLEELILRHALGGGPEPIEREARASGVMMIPIPRGGILREVRGVEGARRVDGIEEVTITARLDNRLVPLPRGSSYLGFIFSRAGAPERAEAALREAHRQLEFVIEPEGEGLRS